MFLCTKKIALWTQAVFAVSLLASVFPAVHADDQVGLSENEVHRMMAEHRETTLFIDVRDPVEIMFIGSTDEVDLNIPFLLVDRTVWDAENNRFRLYRNPDFISEVKAALAAKGLDESATVVTMCRSGSERGLPSARFLQENGFTRATFVTDGFQGGSVKDGAQRGMRVKNGWQNSGLPWSTKMNAEKIYRLDR